MAKRPSEVDARRRARLNAGEVESSNLAEALAVDFAELAHAAGLGADISDQLGELAGEGVTRRMAAAGRLISSQPRLIERCAAHPSDTVRGWACYAIHEHSRDVEEALSAIEPLAADPHFGVREWAWLAIRPRIITEVDRAIELLAGWSLSADQNLRRFASESTRPRGVWCAHIGPLKAEPNRGLPILEPLRADASSYVQDSVANWLNDAAKSRPDWVIEVVQRWRKGAESRATERICRRATRGLAKGRPG